MAAERALALQRLNNRLRHITDWPREDQLAAVEDMLLLVLPSSSSLLNDFRKQVAELTNLESRTDGNPRELQRIKQLERELEKLIDAVDDRLHAQSLAPKPVTRDQKPAESARRPMFMLPAIVASAIALLLGGGYVLASRYYDARLAGQVDRALQSHQGRLDEMAADVDRTLAARLDEAEALRGRFDQLNQDLAKRGESFAGRSDELDVILEEMGRRTGDVGKLIEEVDQTVGALKDEMPVLIVGYSDVADRLAQSRTRHDALAAELDRLEEQAPALMAGLADGSQSLAQRAGLLDELEAQIAHLKERTTASVGALDGALDQGKAQMASWSELDEAVAARQMQVMRDLDLYADSLKQRVQEFIEALNSEAVVPGG